MSIGALTFKRGIHPPDGKAFTESKEIEVVFPQRGSELVFPMSQHIGSPCVPVVSKGDNVLLGQVIGESDTFVSSQIHSSVSGVVKEIRKVLTPTGVVCGAIIVENDGLFKEIDTMVRDPNYKELTRNEILEKIKDAGIVGLGGAGFPTHIKLNPPPDKKIDYIIVNAAECEPYLTTDHRVLLEETKKIIVGLQIILSLHEGAKGIIAIETNKPDAIEKMRSACKNFPNIQVMELLPKYPQGAEKQLIYACTKREVPSGKLPADIGCIVNNVDTVIAIHRAIVRNRPLMRKVVTITGGAVKNPGNYKLRLGMKLEDVLELIGGLNQEPTKIICGGPMMGVSNFDLSVPIVKTSSAFLLLTEKESNFPAEKNCIRCSKCVLSCPMGLIPITLNKNVLADDMGAFKKNNGMDCIECGSCSYICPSKRHLAQSIRVTRRELMRTKR